MLNKKIISKKYGADGLLAWLYPFLLMPCFCVALYILSGLLVSSRAELSVHAILPLVVFSGVFLLLISIFVAWTDCFRMAQSAKVENSNLIIGQFFKKAIYVPLADVEDILVVQKSTIKMLFSSLSVTRNNYLVKLGSSEEILFSGDMEELDEFIQMISQKSGVEVKGA